MRPLTISRLLATGCAAVSLAAHAVDYRATFGLGAEYTDNIRLEAFVEDEDTITTGTLDLAVDAGSGPLEAALRASLEHREYLQNSFSAQDYLGLDALLSWEQVSETLVWKVENYFDQSPVNSLQPDTPSNTEDANVFSFGPDLTLNVSPRSTALIQPRFQDFYYELSGTSNQRLAVDTRWLYRLSQTLQTGVQASYEEIAYDNPAVNPDFDVTTLAAVLSGRRPNATYYLSLGVTKIDRDMFADQDGATGTFEWIHELAGRSRLGLSLYSTLSDSSEEFLRSSSSPDGGDSSNVQTSGDVLRNNTARLNYRHHAGTADTDLWVEARDLDYRQTLNDRKVEELGGRYEYSVTPLVNAGVDGLYRHTRQTDTGLDNKDYILGGDIEYRLSRKLKADFNVKFQKRVSNAAISEYEGFNIFAGIEYTVGKAEAGAP